MDFLYRQLILPSMPSSELALLQLYTTVIASAIYISYDNLVLTKDEPFKRELQNIPFYSTFTIAINVLYIIYKDSPIFSLDKSGVQ